MISTNSNNGNPNSGKVSYEGRTYQTVAYRLAEFRKLYPVDSGWAITTECLSSDDEKVTFKATIKTPEGKAVATGHAQEKRNSSDINRTSAFENCETSAIGRALASCGFIGSEFASADEVALAIREQDSQAEAKPHIEETEPQAKSQTSQAALPAKPEVKTAAEPTSQAAKQPKPSEAPAKPSQVAQEPNEEIAERWTREHQAEWLDAVCPFGKAEGRTWRELAENQGEKIAMKGRPCLPRAYLHALQGWDSCKVWQRMKAKVVLEVIESKNGTHSYQPAKA